MLHCNSLCNNYNCESLGYICDCTPVVHWICSKNYFWRNFTDTVCGRRGF